MLELLHFAFSGINFIPTLLLIFVTIYWLIVIIGLIDAETLDVDLEMDVDVDADVEFGGLASVLSYFNIGQMPLMMFLTFFTIPLWMLTLISTDLLGINSWPVGLVVFIPFVFMLLVHRQIFDHSNRQILSQGLEQRPGRLKGLWVRYV